jgi:hypothetical protein
MKLAGQGRKARHARAAELLEVLGVAHCTRRRPDQMSGGEQQRVAIVLVVTHDPGVSANVRRVIAIRDGRTSTETLRHDDGDGSALGHAIEYAVLDRAGRLQLPRDMTDTLRMRDRVRLELEPDHIGVWPDQRPKGQASSDPTGSGPAASSPAASPEVDT